MLVKKIIINKADRLYQMPPELLDFAHVQGRQPLIRRADLIDLANLQWPITFSPDQSVEPAALASATPQQIDNCKEELLAWLARHHQVRLTNIKEILLGPDLPALLFNLAVAFVDEGDPAFVPGVGIPHYRRVVSACGGVPVPYLMSEKTEWRPQTDRIAGHLTRVARLLFLNSPHDPSGAELNEKEMSRLAWTAGKENLLVVNDASYLSIPERRPISLLAVEGGKRVGVEIYSCSMLFGLPQLPFAFAAGNREALAGANAVRSLFRPHFPKYYIDMMMQALREYPNNHVRAVRQQIGQAHAEARNLLELINLEATGSPTVPFLWARIHRRTPSSTLARLLYRRYRVLVVPGSSMGELGEGYLRFSLTAGASAFRDAAARIKKRLNLLTRGTSHE